MATSIGDVLKLDRLSRISSFGGKSGAGSSAPGKLHFEANFFFENFAIFIRLRDDLAILFGLQEKARGKIKQGERKV